MGLKKRNKCPGKGDRDQANGSFFNGKKKGQIKKTVKAEGIPY